MSAAASFDALRLCAEISAASGAGAAAVEIHTFAYLGCLLSVYEDRPPAEWGYGFRVTPAGAPYSDELDSAMKTLRAGGMFVNYGHAFDLSSPGRADLELLCTHATNRARLRYLSSAAGTALLMPLPAVTSALSREPQLQEFLGAPTSRDLLDEVGVDAVKAHFEVITRVLADRDLGDDLTVPASLWLTALAEQASDG